MSGDAMRNTLAASAAARAPAATNGMPATNAAIVANSNERMARMTS
jgi:hypothetical protein